MLARALMLATALVLAACAAEPTKPTSPPEPTAPRDCPAKSPDGGVYCPTGCEQLGDKCLRPKGIIAPH